MLASGRKPDWRIECAPDDHEIPPNGGASRYRRAAADDHEGAPNGRRARDLRLTENDHQITIDSSVNRGVAHDDRRFTDGIARIEPVVLADANRGTSVGVDRPLHDIDIGRAFQWLLGSGLGEQARGQTHREPKQECQERETDAIHDWRVLPSATRLSAAAQAVQAAAISRASASA